MATGKQINELTQAGSVGASDVVAIAQSGNTEATKASMTQLAQAIAQINETGALAELVYATSQGKALLAQYLTEKGVPTEASETLIQMADKVDLLSVDSSVENILAHGLTSHSFALTSSEGNMCMQTVGPNNDFIVVEASTGNAYYVPNGYYANAAAMIAAATSEVNVGFTAYSSSYAHLYITEGSQYAWYRGTGTSQYCRITIDVANKQLSNPTNFTCPFTVTDGSYSVAFAAGNDGILWINTGRSCYGRFWNTNNNWYSPSASYLSTSGELTSPILLRIMNQRVYHVMPYAQSYPLYQTLRYTPYTVDENTGEVTKGSHVYYNDVSNVWYNCRYDVDSKLFFYFDNSETDTISETATVAYKTCTWHILSLNGDDNKPHDYQVALYPMDPGRAGTTYFAYNRAPIVLKNNDGTYSISFCGIPNAITFDPSDNTFVDNVESNSKKLLVYDSGSAISGAISPAVPNLVAMSDDNGYTFNVYASNSSGSNVTTTRAKLNYTDYLNLIGKVRHVNDYTTYYLADYITEARVAGGAYAINTTITPSVPDEA